MLDGTARRSLDGDDVHAVDRVAGDAISRGLAVDVGLGLGPLQRRAHRVEVVLADEQHRQLPQRGEVHAFVELALGDRAVAEEAGGDRVAALHLVAKRDADRERQPAADDGVAAVEPGRAVEQVHRAAAAAAAAFCLP